MEHKSFYTKTRTVHAHVIGLKGSQGETLVVSIHSVKTGKKLNLYKLPLELKDEVSKIKSYSALVAFAKANHIADIVADAKQTSCPVPAPAPAKSAAKGQGILFSRWTLLAETVSEDALWPYCPFCNEHTDIDQFNHNGGACNFCADEVQSEFDSIPVNGSAVPLNLE